MITNHFNQNSFIRWTYLPGSHLGSTAGLSSYAMEYVYPLDPAQRVEWILTRYEAHWHVVAYLVYPSRSRVKPHTHGKFYTWEEAATFVWKQVQIERRITPYALNAALPRWPG